jgi:hypothetical protein
MDHTPGMAGSIPLLPPFRPMKRTWLRFSQRYQAALAQLLKHGPGASLQPVQDLGRRASAIGIGTLDLARFHAEALVTPEPSSTQDDMIERPKVPVSLSEPDPLIGNRSVTLSSAAPVGPSQPLKATVTDEQAVLLGCSLAGAEHPRPLAAGVNPLRSQKSYSGSTAGVCRLDFRSTSSHLDPKKPGYYLTLLRAGLHRRLLHDRLPIHG